MQVRAAGHVLLARDADTLPVAQAPVVLHRIGRDVQGPIDSVRTDSHGGFRFRFPLDTGAIFLLSARFAGIEYFSTPVHTDPALPDTALTLIVSDTSASAPVVTASRHVVVSRPGTDGGRPALEIVVLENRGDLTRVAPDSLSTTWSEATPHQAIGMQSGNGDFSPEALRFERDSALLSAPISPGEKRVIFSYLLPASATRVTLPVSDSIEAMNLLVEESSAKVTGPLTPADTERIEGRLFRRWTGGVAPGSRIELVFAGQSSNWLLPLLVTLVGTAFVGAFLLLRRRLAARPAAALAGADLVDRLARLEAQFAGRQAEVSPVEWDRYLAERARLKQELASHLAGGGPSA